MGLKAYSSRRKFGKTPEPKGTVPDLRSERSEGVESGLSPYKHKGESLIFVVHKHAARALHYDLRLELDGVLKSWAVPKGPSLDPSVKRLAVMVEDHPFEYKDFEGVIPEGNYGAGSVIIWDRGFYHHPAARDTKHSGKLLREGLKKGDIKFVLEGEKLHGEFALVKTGKDAKSWLLLKKKDKYAAGEDTLRDNRSVASHRTLEEVARSAMDGVSIGRMNRIRIREAEEGEDLSDAPVKPLPHKMKPMLATLAGGPFDHPDWIFEVKWDGYRAVARVQKGGASLYSRNGMLLNQKFSPIAQALQSLEFEAIMDGEIVVVDDRGHPDFQMLQDYRGATKGHLIYYVFDLLHFRGHDLTGLPLLRRKGLLKRILPAGAVIRFSDHVRGEGVSFFEAARKQGLEGIMAKHSQSAYLAGRRSRQWMKVKTRLTQEGVVAGFTAPRGRRRYFGSLVLGVYEKGNLRYIGQSGGGFTAGGLEEIRGLMEPLIRKRCPFDPEPAIDSPVTWLKPQLVCEVAFQGWTGEGLMRQPVFLRLREDKAARAVVREEPEK